jgi:hypothetical protein
MSKISPTKFEWKAVNRIFVPPDIRDQLILAELAAAITGEKYLSFNMKFEEGTEIYEDSGKPTTRRKYRLVKK